MPSLTFVTDLIPNAGVYLQLFRFVVVLFVGLVLTRALLLPSISYLLKRRGARKETRQSVENLASVVGVFFSFTVALQAGNFGNLVTIIGAIAAALTVAIGFGMRDQVSNVVAGFFIYLNNPFLVGDYIKTEETEGVVDEIAFLSTTLEGRSSRKVVVPNSQLTTEEMKNYTQGSKTKASIDIELSNENLGEGTTLLREIAERNEAVLDSPAPDIFYNDAGRALTAEVQYWIGGSRRAKRVKSDILEEFNEKAIERDLFGDGTPDDE